MHSTFTPANDGLVTDSQSQRLRDPLAVLLSGTDILRHYGSRLPSDECDAQREQMLEAAALLSALLAQDDLHEAATSSTVRHEK